MKPTIQERLLAGLHAGGMLEIASKARPGFRCVQTGRADRKLYWLGSAGALHCGTAPSSSFSMTDGPHYHHLLKRGDEALATRAASKAKPVSSLAELLDGDEEPPEGPAESVGSSS